MVNVISALLTLGGRTDKRESCRGKRDELKGQRSCGRHTALIDSSGQKVLAVRPPLTFTCSGGMAIITFGHYKSLWLLPQEAVSQSLLPAASDTITYSG